MAIDKRRLWIINLVAVMMIILTKVREKILVSSLFSPLYNIVEKLVQTLTKDDEKKKA